MSDAKLNILVIHQLGAPEVARFFLLKHVFFLRNCFPQHNYLYHDLTLPIPDFVKDVEFDGVVLDFTSLQWRSKSPEVFAKVKEDLFSFLKDKRSFKIAMPQDEYDSNELLDDWMCELDVDVVYSVIPVHWDILYPKYSKKGNIRLGFTGYIDDSLIALGDNPKPFKDRPIDVGYRARKVPYSFGRIGEIKYRIATDFLVASSKTKLKCNISIKEEDTIIGSEWLGFINDCKFTLGSNSGSSLLDPRGEIRRNVHSYCQKNPLATFEEVEELFFKGEDGKYEFTAISPRIFEAGLLKSGQILVKGGYSGIIKPWEHYIPLNQDFSNFDEVYNAMRDQGFVNTMIEACCSTLRESKVLRYENQAAEILTLIAEGAPKKHVSHISDDEFLNLETRYNDLMKTRYKLIWQYAKTTHRFKMALKNYPVMYYPLLVAHRSIRKALHKMNLFHIN